MSLLIAVTGWAPSAWLDFFRRQASGLTIVDAGETYDAAAVEFAAVWKPEPGTLAQLPNLKAIFNLGAGVDALMADPTLPDVPVVRVVDPDLTQRMTEYVVWQVLHHHRGGFHFAAAQGRKIWEPIAGVRHFAGDGELDAFLATTDILVVLLPLTETTRGMLDRRLFGKLARDGRLGGPILINAGRGGLQVEADIVACLDDGTLKGASLDVFEPEPLPEASLLWRHPRVVITPHVAADSDPKHLVTYVLGQIARIEAGGALENVVDRAKGY